MSKETIFFSYSRDNTEFVMNLAKILRKAGANLWLDQLDIKVGENWDIAVQTALQESETFLIVLSKDSVASNNVMDEVGYALGANKKVVPVLMEECEIPFRLQRRQFADFSGDQQKGIENLIEALELDADVAEKLSDVSNRSSLTAQLDAEEIKKLRKVDKEKVLSIPKPDPASKPDGPQKPKVKPDSPSKSKSKLPIYIVAGVVVIALGIWGVLKMGDNGDSEAFEAARIGNSIASYDLYLSKFKEGKFREKATYSIDSIKAVNDTLADQTAWKNAITEIDLEVYKRDSESGKLLGLHASEVDDKINNIQKTQSEAVAWKTAKDKNSIDGYFDYIKSGKASPAKLQDAISAFKTLGKAGWLYSGNSNGSGQYFSIIWRADGSEISSTTIPKKGDIVVTKSGRSTYNSFQSCKAVGTQGRAVKTNDKAYVNSVKECGNALFLEIIYK